MKNVLLCRRTFIAVLSLVSLVTIAIINHADVSMAVASIAVALAGANSVENTLKSKFENAPKDS